MNSIRPLALIITILFLGGCWQQVTSSERPNTQQELTVAGASIVAPAEATIWPAGDPSWRMADTDRNMNDLDSLDEYRITMALLKSNTRLPNGTPILDASCSPALTGVSKWSGDTIWERVDFWDRSNALSDLFNSAPDPNHYQEPICRPPELPVSAPPCPTPEEQRTLSKEELQWLDCGQRHRTYALKHGLNSAYILCSEHNGKTVVICLSQATDNPKMAEEIFRTFRWTE